MGTMGIIGNKAFSNPFYRTSSLEILFFFAGWGIWWSFFQIWLTTNQGFTGAQVGTIYSFGSAVALLLMFVYGSIQDKLGMKKNLLIFLVSCEIFLAPFFTWIYVPMLESNFYIGAIAGAVYLAVSYLAACPVFEAVTERMSRRYNFEYGQARGFIWLCNISIMCRIFIYYQSLFGFLGWFWRCGFTPNYNFGHEARKQF